MKDKLINYTRLKELLKPYSSQLNIDVKNISDIESIHDASLVYTEDCQRVQGLGLESLANMDLNDLFGWDYKVSNFYFDLRDFEVASFSSWHWLDIISEQELAFLDKYIYYIGDFPTGDGFFQIAKGKNKAKLAIVEHGAAEWIEEVIETIDKSGTADEIIDACEFIQVIDEFSDLEDYFIQRISSLKPKVNKKKAIVKAIKKNKDDSILKLSGMKLIDIPEDVFERKDILELDLSNNNIKQIGDWIGGFTQLTVLKLNNNEISYISPKIKNLKNLRVLDLSHNHFTGALPGYLVNFEHLEELSLMCVGKNNREVMTMPDELFQLKKITNFSNGGVYFSNYPCSYGIEGSPLNMNPEAFAMECLKDDDNTSPYEYVFNNGDSKTISSLLERMYDSDTKTMDLSVSVVFSRLPKELLDFDIKCLNLKECELGIGTDIDSTKKTSKEIRAQYTEIHISNLAVLKDMTTLEELDLSKNGILALPDLSKLSQLKRISLYGNHLTDLSGLSALQQLAYLDLSGNELLSIPEGLFDLSQLTHLDISNNFMQTEDVNIAILAGMGRLTNLEVLQHTTTTPKDKLKKTLPKGCKIM